MSERSPVCTAQSLSRRVPFREGILSNDFVFPRPKANGAEKTPIPGSTMPWQRPTSRQARKQNAESEPQVTRADASRSEPTQAEAATYCFTIPLLRIC